MERLFRTQGDIQVILARWEDYKLHNKLLFSPLQIDPKNPGFYRIKPNFGDDRFNEIIGRVKLSNPETLNIANSIPSISPDAICASVDPTHEFDALSTEFSNIAGFERSSNFFREIFQKFVLPGSLYP